MTRNEASQLMAFFLLWFARPHVADKHRDPLTNDEVDKIRELTDQPEKAHPALRGFREGANAGHRTIARRQ